MARLAPLYFVPKLAVFAVFPQEREQAAFRSVRNWANRILRFTMTGNAITAIRVVIPGIAARCIGRPDQRV